MHIIITLLPLTHYMNLSCKNIFYLNYDFVTVYYIILFRLWLADPLLGNDREISSYTIAVAK
jgi:hypothetical protein